MRDMPSYLSIFVKRLKMSLANSFHQHTSSEVQHGVTLALLLGTAKRSMEFQRESVQPSMLKE